MKPTYYQLVLFYLSCYYSALEHYEAGVAAGIPGLIEPAYNFDSFYEHYKHLLD